MIQDIAPHTYHNEYRPVAPDGSSFVLAYENGKSFFHKNDTDNSIEPFNQFSLSRYITTPH